ncbi:conserved hypothetical protein [Ricinus communis]|uniref:Ribosome biogenesis protein NOP53 n=1 Tax=Ricinus communis TaxID=3988 RepID=B9S4A4_RICCO|nr:conserved hypothetical protein [Ricinus communis]
MGKKPKSSRKGKKAWRANISTEDIDNFIEKSTKDSLSGGSLSHVPTESLFFVDKSKDLSVRRKIEKHREKVLRCDSVLQKNPFVQVVPSSNQKKGKKKKIKKTQIDSEQKDGAKEDGAIQDSGMVDLWGNEGECDNKTRKISNPSVIPAVEVVPPGCSYNPSFEAHQDSLAQAVAEEMQKVYQSELGPQPVPLTVPAEHQAINEEDMYFLEADDGDDDEDNLIENEDAEKRRFLNSNDYCNDIGFILMMPSLFCSELYLCFLAIDVFPIPIDSIMSTKTKRVTRVEFNRRARLKEQKRKEAEAKKKDGVSKEIDSLTDIIKEIAKEDEEKNKRHIRRIVAKEERLKTRPSRLGKHKFEPAPPQVLLTEEITGSLRKLKGCCTLLRDRFKSLEKRGLIAPMAKNRRSVKFFSVNSFLLLAKAGRSPSWFMSEPL